jgi:gentisate 1,2-dioxygenase
VTVGSDAGRNVVARDLRSHPVTPNPRRNTLRASFDDLAGNTTIGILLTEFGAERIGHRHLDEATTFIVAGSGRTEVRSHEDISPTWIEWSAGDMFAIPSNAWHRHESDAAAPARQLTVKSTPLMNALFGSRAFVRENPFSFDDRYAQAEAWTESLRVADWTEASSHRAAPAPLERSNLGDGVRASKLSLAGQRMLESWLVELGAGARTRTQRELVEQVFVVLGGSGDTTLFGDDSDPETFAWGVGDLVAIPLGLPHSHQASVDGARLLLVRNVFLELALGANRVAALTGNPGPGGDA